MKKIAFLAVFLSLTSFQNVQANEDRRYTYHTNPYSVHRPYRPGYFGMNNYYDNEARCAKYFGRGTLAYQYCMSLPHSIR
ncbi:hypothetical protein OQH60_02230 [Campylobacter sp. MIT 21-1685]|uniref:hypothetical protein n=1 Tax=unclassified Campylobacter TaxID=2593542 RepID=UPI00224A6DD2|nr:MULTISPECIES: hypothetical protein [unclassified Campylobacter]MCX2682612.1 hypothetical protein [Campylobacter sp. MIT 21-1684]MCX2750892.1 hypothetical protein [Campylobacter sp. MIT 21-1682]MCX2807175.1 hypothetical protein [Campylobacter sp. MIT 21-1685]